MKKRITRLSEDVAQFVECFCSRKKPWVYSLAPYKQGGAAFRRWKQEHQKFKAILGYILEASLDCMRRFLQTKARVVTVDRMPSICNVLSSRHALPSGDFSYLNVCGCPENTKGTLEIVERL